MGKNLFTAPKHLVRMTLCWRGDWREDFLTRPQSRFDDLVSENRLKVTFGTELGFIDVIALGVVQVRQR